MCNININHIKEFIKLLLLLYYKNFIFYPTLIFINCKFILLIKYLILIFYYNKKFLIEKFLNSKICLFFQSKIHNKILNIKVTSKTTKSNIIQKFSVISVIGNKMNWVGIGVAKDRKLVKAAKSAYRNAFKNIIYFNLKICHLKNFKSKFKKTKLIIYRHNFFHTNNSTNLNNICNYIGFFINSKIVGVSSNLINLLSIIKNLSNITLI